MAYTVLARRYRSSTFDEVVGQDHVARTLKRAIESGRIAHAYLFCGTRGVGKTSMARILAKALNCEKAQGPTTEPCMKCNSCQAIARGDDIDVIEIDAASNTQVDKTRDIIDNAQYRPARSRFKVYIIDEVHMLSKASFNALLKTLEEPPEHVKFILATTEPEKVLPTILSRCQRYDFHNIPTREIAGHLKAICEQEKIQAQDDALMLVAKAGAGSMRDSLSLLDRLLSIGEKQLTVETIEQLLGLPHSQGVFDLVQAIGEGRVKDVLDGADRMIREGLSPDGLMASLIDHLRNLLVIRTCGKDSTLVEVAALSLDELAKQAQRFEAVVLTQDIAMLEELRRQMRQAQAGRALLDATLVRLSLAEQFTAISELLSRVNGGTTAASGGQKKKPEPAVMTAATPPVQMAPPPPRPVVAPPVPVVVTPPPAAAAPVAAPPASVAAVESGAAPAVSASLSPSDFDDDDDLPRPGKVWDGGSVSLTTLMKQQCAAAQQPAVAAPPPAPAAPSSAAKDLAGVWSSLLTEIQDKPGLYSLVSAGQLAAIQDGQAILSFADDQFPKMLSRNGKRELLGEMFTRLCGQPTGVRFEVQAGQPASSPPPPAPPPRNNGNNGAANGHAQAARPAEADRPAPAAPPAPPPSFVRPTPEQFAEFERDPLIGGLMSKLGATIIKISED